MSQQIGVSLKFTADTTAAKAQVQDLQNQLTKITNLDTSKSFDISGELEKGIAAASKLKVILDQSLNTSTGQLDLSKFNQSLKSSGTTLKEFQNSLSGIGPEGTKAFATLTQSITTAEIPLRRTNSLLNDFAVTLKNTAKWQISSNLMHGLDGAIKSAYGYAKNLNESLNNIRIVTGNSTEQMAQFAIDANKAAKALSTTTTEYTDASLIYYQQGLNDQQVKERTDVTIKMANVSRQSAEIVSDQMTAVWNNFDDGSKSLEYYADVMTALGAATASSTDEIAQGLEKFAAIAETVGLSYEYATTALATVTAETRQSADVVGTAFKTMFARIQGLELGDTLEDGTTLNEYSNALMKVGINIKDANGDLKQMDTILNEMGATWQTLNKDEQVALAQKVAGVRQYSQLIALMDNWDKFQVNLGIAEGSEGALQEQADIYAESWEAARDRVTAALESIYGKLLKDDVFIDLLNGIENVISGVDFLIDSLGGVTGIITTLGSIATKVFHEQMATGIRNFAYNIKMATKAGRQELIDLKVEANKQMIQETADYATGSGGAAVTAYQLQSEEQINYIHNVERMSQMEALMAEQLMKNNSVLRERSVIAAEIVESIESQTAAYEEQVAMSMRKNNNINEASLLEDFKGNAIGKSQGALISSLISSINLDSDQGIQKLKTSLSGLIQEYDKLGIELNDDVESAVDALIQSLERQDITIDEAKNGILQFTKTIDNLDSNFDRYRESLKETLALQAMYADSTLEESDALKKSEEILTRLENKYQELAQSQQQQAQASQNMNKSHKETLNMMNNAKGATIDWADGLLYGADAIMSVVSLTQMFNSVWDTLQNPDTSGWEKFTAVMSTSAMAIMTIIPALNSMKKLIDILKVGLNTETAAKLLNAAASWLQVKADNAVAKAKSDSANATSKNTKETAKDTASKIFNTTIKKTTGKDGKDYYFKTDEAGKFKKVSKDVASQYVKDLGTMQSGTAKTVSNFTPLLQSLKKIGTQVLRLGKTFGPTAVAIAATTAAVVGLVQVYHKANRQLAEAQTQAEETNKVYNSIKDSFSTLISTMSNYTSATDALKNMTAGTAEFKEQTAKANEEALKLIQTYDSLAGKYHTEDGLIIIDPKALEEVKKNQAEILENAQQSAALANQEVQDKQEAVDMTKFRRETRTTTDKVGLGAGVAAGASYGAATGAAIGSIIPGLGTAIGTAIGTALGTVLGGVAGFVGMDKVDEQSTNDALEKLEKAYSEEGNAVFADLEQTLRDLGITDEDLIKQLTDNQSATQELIVAMNANTLASNALNESIIQQEFGDQIKNKGLSDYGQNQVTKMMGTNLETLTEELYNSTYKDAIGNMTDAEVQKKYAEAMGWDTENIDNNKGNTGTYYDKEGNVVAEKLDDDIARKFLAQQAAIKQLGGEVDSYISTLKEIVNVGNTLGSGIGDALSTFAGGDGGDLSSLNKSDLKNLDTSKLNISADQAKKMGYESVEDFKKAINDAKGVAEKAWEGISDTFADLTLEEAKVLQEAEKNSISNVQDVKNYYDGLSSDEKSLFLQIDFDRLTTEKEWNSEIEYLRNQASLEKVQVQLETVQSAQGLMSEDMTVEDYSSIETSGIDWGNAEQGIIEFSEFVKMTYTEQQSYLQGLEDTYRASTIRSAEQMKEAAISRLDTEKQKLEELKIAQEDYQNASFVDKISGRVEKITDEDIASQEQAINDTQSQINKAESTIAVAQRQKMEDLGLDAEEYENLAKHIQDVADETDDLSDDLKYNEKAAKKTAEAILRFDKAIQKVDESYDDWKHTLDSGSLQDQAEVVGELKNAYADMLDIDMDSLSDDFVKNADNLELMKKAANGSEEAYNELQRLAGEDILMQIGIDKSQYETDLADINALALETEGLGLADIEAGASLDNTDFLNGLTDIVNKAGMTAAEATDYLASMGVDAEIEEVKSKTTDVQEYGGVRPTLGWKTAATIPLPDILGGPQPLKLPTINWEPFTVPAETNKETTATGIKVISANKSSGGGIKYKNSKAGGGTGRGGGKKKGGGGGSKSAPAKAEQVKKTKKSDVVDRYKEITDALNDNTRALDKANKKADQLYGPGRIKWLQKANQLIREQNTLLKQQQTQAKTNLTQDKKALNNTAKAAGLSFTYDASGNISNYTIEMEKLFKQLAQAETTINSFATKDQQDKYKESTLQPIQDKIDALKDAQAQYEETRTLIQDLQEQYEDNLVQLFDNDLEIVTIAVELNLDAAEAGLEWIEYQLKKIEDQAYSTAKAIALLTNQIPELENRQETNELRKEKTLETLVEHGYFSQKDVNNFNKGNMNAINWSKIPESAMDELLSYREELYSINEAYMELRDTINGSVIEAFEKWSEEMHDQMELFDYYDSVITSYQNIADLGGKRLGITDKDLIAYEQEKVNNANNRLAGSKSYYDQTKVHRDDIANQLAAAEKRYKAYQAAGDTAGMQAEAINIKDWKETLKTAEEELRDAETTYLEDWQSALEASRDAFLKETEIELKALEEQMAGTYGTIEEMQKEFDRKSEINERYLQDYERIYELSKLNRDLTKKMDETSNVKAKQELAKLQEEILEYQEEGRKISQYDLEYLQKRYDLKLAEIAMEEAQNAKTQVRLTRDSEGNYSYTYTADEDSMADSQQSYEDKLYAITDLSNKHIEEQTSLLLSTQQQYLDALNEIHQKAAEGQYATTEEYQKALDECTAYYTEKMRYHSGEIDKATLNNAVVYAEDYATYETYIGKKLTEDEKLQRQMDANIIKAKADVEKLQIEKQAALDEIHRLNAEGYYASEEEYQAALARVEEQYNNRIDKATEKVNISVANREQLYGKDAKAYSLEAAKKEAAENGVILGVEKLLPRWDKAQGSMTNYVKDMTDKIGSAKEGTGYLGQVVKSYGTLETNVNTAMKNAGSSIKGFKNDIKKKLITDTDSIQNQSKKAAKSIQTIGDASKDLSKTIKDVTNWQKDYSKQIQLAINKNEAFIKSINNAQKAAAKQAKKAVEKKKEPDKPTTPSSSEDNKKEKLKTDAKAIVTGVHTGTIKQTASGWEVSAKKAGYSEQAIKLAKTAIDNSDPSKGWNYRYDKALEYLAKYNTGGYTGNWGSEGKLAMLHEKELVLNKQDTENMLKMISMVRDLSNVLDMQAYQASLAQLQANHLYHVNSSGETFEQTVTIHAEFPDAVYATEIETALNNLVNSASQYANRKY